MLNKMPITATNPTKEPIKGPAKEAGRTCSSDVKILFLEDDPDFRMLYCELLKEYFAEYNKKTGQNIAFTIKAPSNDAELRQALCNGNQYRLLITDYSILKRELKTGNGNGETTTIKELLENMQERQKNIKGLLLSAQRLDRICEENPNINKIISDYVVKGHSYPGLTSRVSKLLGLD